MKSLIVGIIIQLCALYSVIFIFRPMEPGKGVDTFVCGGGGAARGVLVISQGFGSLAGRTRGRVEYKQSLVQLDEMYPILAGVQDHIAFKHSRHLDNLLKGVDVVVYAGPSGVIDSFIGETELISFAYPRLAISAKPSLVNDEFVFRSMHNVLQSGLKNASVGKSLSKKVLFVLFLNSVAIENLSNGGNLTEVYRAEMTLRKALEDLQTHIYEYYSDQETIFVSVPHWSITKDRNSIISVWGRGVKESFVPPIRMLDVCPLVATLLGVPIPTESAGILPLPFLNSSLKEEAKALACNAIQLHQLVFKRGVSRYNQTIMSILDHIRQKQYKKCKVLSEQLIQTCQLHMHNSKLSFDSTVFYFVAFGLIGWIFVLISEPMLVLTGNRHLTKKSFIVITFLFILIALCQFIYLTFVWHYPYPCIIIIHMSLLPWLLLLSRYKTIWDWCQVNASVETLVCICIIILLEEIIVISLDGGFPAVFILAIVGTLPLVPQFLQTPFIYSIVWYVSCSLVLGLWNFPRELVNSRKQFLNFASTLWLFYGQATVFFFDQKRDSIISQILVFYLLISTILGNAFILLPTIPPALYYLSWAIMSSLVLPFFGSRKIEQVLIHVSMSFGPSFVLLSRELESLSYIALMVFVVCWVFLERSYMSTCDKYWCDIRRGGLLALSCSIGYLMSGTIEENTPPSLLTAFLPLGIYWNNEIPYYGFLIFKYFAVFVIVITVYISLISRKWKADMGYVYGLLLIEIICLRVFMQVIITSMNTSDVINKHIFINTFAILFMLSYYLGLFYSPEYIKKETKDFNEIILEEHST